MKTPKVSFILGNLNKQSWIAESLHCLTTQTLKDIEIVIVDDASTDYSVDVIEHYASKDKRIKFLRNDINKGISYTYNKATENSTGEIICVAASDDVYSNNRAKWTYDYLKRHKEYDVVYFPFFKSYHDLSQPPFELKDAEPFDLKRLKQRGGQFIGHGFMGYTRKVADTVKYRNDQLYGCDHSFLLDICKAGFKFGRVELPKKQGKIDMEVVHAGKAKIAGTYRFTPSMVSVIQREYIVNHDKELEKEYELVNA